MNIFQNPGLKALAILLAVGLWYGITLQKRAREGSWSLDVPVEVQVPADYILTRQSPDRVVLSGRGGIPPHNSLAYAVRLDHPREGVQTLQLSTRGLPPSRGADYIGLAPSSVELTVDRRGRKEVPLEIPLSLSSRDLSIQLYPKKAVLSGPKKVLAQIRAVTVPPVTLLDRYPQISIAALVSPHPLVAIVTPQEVTVVVQKKTP
jgi:hypothetical protein